MTDTSDTTKRMSSTDQFVTSVQNNGTTLFLCTKVRHVKDVVVPCNGTYHPLVVEVLNGEGGRAVRFQCHRCKTTLTSYVYPHESLPYPLQNDVVRDVMSLSSGTMAVISATPWTQRASRGPNLDYIQRTWWAWVEDQAWNAVTYERWQDAWEAWVLYQNEAPESLSEVMNRSYDYQTGWAEDGPVPDEAVYGDAVVGTLSKSLVVEYLRAEWEAVKRGEESWVRRANQFRTADDRSNERYADGMAQAFASAAARFQRTLKELTGEEVR